MSKYNTTLGENKFMLREMIELMEDSDIATRLASQRELHHMVPY